MSLDDDFESAKFLISPAAEFGGALARPEVRVRRVLAARPWKRASTAAH
ncbi:hypothetical protein [Nocardia wallacei]|nr:hypothetical protein [Nocardia wallacei]